MSRSGGERSQGELEGQRGDGGRADGEVERSEVVFWAERYVSTIHSRLSFLSKTAGKQL